MKLAFVGLGNMGLPMAHNLVKAGYEVYGKNRSAGKEAAFAELGGITGKTLKELAAEVDVLMTCLPMPADVEEIYLGPDGVIRNGRTGLILIDFSTVSPDLNQSIAAAAKDAGMAFLDAPVSGGTQGALQGTLSVMVGGEKTVYEQVLPLFEIVGKNIYHVGDTGTGTAVKLLNQLMVGIHTQAASEAMLLAEQMGIRKDMLHGILSASFAQSRIYDRHYTQFIEKEQYAPGFALELLHKDLALAEKMAKDHSVTLPVGSFVEDLLASAKEKGYAGQDMSSMFLYMKERNQAATERKYYAVFLPMKDMEKSIAYRPQHLAFLEEQRNQGRLFANGRFVDGAGGFVVYIGESEEQVKSWVEQDPYIIEGARGYEIHEWDLVKGHLY